MVDRNAIRIYTFFIASTLVAATLFFFGLKTFFGIEHALFFVFVLGQIHYLMAYLWSTRSYRLMDRKIAVRNIGGWALASAFFFIGVFWLEFIPFSGAVLFAVLISVFHNFRDYEFFFRQLRSNFTDPHRTFAITGALSAFYFLLFFGILIVAPAQGDQMFGMRLPVFVSGGFFWATIVLLVSCCAILAKQYKLTILTSAWRTLPIRMHSVAFVLPFPLIQFLAQISTLELFYFFASWHFIAWFGFIGLKIAHRRAECPRVSLHDTRSKKRPFTGFLEYWQKNVYTFTCVTAACYTLLCAIFFTGRAFGVFLPLRVAVYQSFFWGVGGFVFFSVVHILFAALPRPRL